MQNYFPVSTSFVSRTDDEETISIEAVDQVNGIYEMSNGETMIHQQIINNYIPMELMTESLFDKQIVGADGTTDGAMRSQIEKNKENFGLDLVADASMFDHLKPETPIQSTHEIVHESTGFDFNKSVEEATFVYKPKSQEVPVYTEQVIQEPKKFEGDVLYESFKKMVSDIGSPMTIGEIMVKLPTYEQIKQFRGLFNVDKEKLKEYIKDLLKEPETVEFLLGEISESITNKLDW